MVYDMTYTTIKIPKEIHLRLGALAVRTQLSRQDVLLRGIKELEDKLFWEECQKKYKETAASGPDDTEEALYENTISDGLDDEY